MKKVEKKLKEIISLIMKINSSKKHKTQVFFSISPHVSDISVSVYKNGWRFGIESDFDKIIYYNKKTFISEIEELKNILRRMLNE